MALKLNPQSLAPASNGGTVKETAHADDRSRRSGSGHRAAQRLRPQEPLGTASGGAELRLRLEAFDRTMRGALGRAAPMLLRVSLATVFVWFGALKVAGVSAVGGLVASTVPFLASAWFVPVLGVLEILIGLAFMTGQLLRVVLPVFALHLGGTFLVLITLPNVAFEQSNPLLLTVVGEFVVKNLVLLSAARRRVGCQAAAGERREPVTDCPNG